MVSFVDKLNVSPLGMEPQILLLYHLDDDACMWDTNGTITARKSRSTMRKTSPGITF
jgi:hypothetical protein